MVNSDSDGSLPPCEVQLHELDTLVLESLQAPSPAAKACAELRQQLDAGNVDSGLLLLKTECPQLLEDERYTFKLIKNKFVAMCRSKGADKQAIACARKELAPLALNAYPAAYTEFKQSLRLLVLNPDEHAAYLAEHNHPDVESALETQEELASSVYHAARHAMGVRDPALIVLLAYLLHLHNLYAPTHTSQEAQLATSLLLKERDAPPLPSEGTGPGSSSSEASIQALIHCGGISRREAVNALRRCSDDVESALHCEMARLRLNAPLVCELLHEYIEFRGLAENVRTGAVGSPGNQAGAWWQPGHSKLQNNRSVVETLEADASCSGDGIAKGFGPAAAGGQCTSSSQASMLCERKDACDSVGNATLSSTSGSLTLELGLSSVRQNLLAQHPDRSMSQSPPTKVPRCEDVKETAAIWQSPLEGRTQECLVQLAQLCKAGMVDDALELICQLDSEFLSTRPDLSFELRRARFLQLLAEGDSCAALTYCRAYMAPLAEQEVSLGAALKAATAAILTGPDAAATEWPRALAAVSSHLQAGLRSHLGVHAPRLVRLLGVLLAVHRHWTRREKYADPFAAGLRLDELRAPAVDAMADGGAATNGARAGSGGGEVNHTRTSIMPDLEYSDSDNGDSAVDEESILRLMEVLEVPRSASIELLMQHDGDIEAAIMNSLG